MVLLAVLLFSRKPDKAGMLRRVVLTCLFIWLMLAFLVLTGHLKRPLTFAFWTFFAHRRVLAVYLIAVNLVTLILFAVDKKAAAAQRTRIPIVTLLGFAFLGGSAGALAGMYLFRHKTNKNYFTVSVPLFLLTQAAVLFFVMNARF